MPRFLVLALFVTMAAPTWAQQTLTQEEIDLAANNIGKMHSSITLDRTMYFAGEVARITYRVENPTANALVVPDPRQSTELNVSCPGSSRPCTMADNDLIFGSNTQLVTLQPGGVIEFTILSTDYVPGLGIQTVEPFGTVPIWACHAIFYGAWGRAEFDVEAPLVAQMATAKYSHKARVSPAEGIGATGTGHAQDDSDTGPGKMSAMLLESGSDRAIVVPHGTFILGPRDRPLGFLDVKSLAPFHRVATVNGPVQNLQISFPKDTDELIDVRWKEGSQQRAVRLDSQRNPVPVDSN